jgi:hypothetical protein
MNFSGDNTMKMTNRGPGGARRVNVFQPMAGLLAAGLLFGSMAAQAAPGAIWTSLKSGATVNANLYAAKCGDPGVWLNGGPNNSSGGGGLPEGGYVFQVTDPSGATLLSSDPPLNRQVTVDDTGFIVGIVEPGHSVNDLGDDPLTGPAAVELCPFANTPNNGGEYKVWLTPVASFIDPDIGNCVLETGKSPSGVDCAGKFGFVGGHIKTDNFKAPDEPSPECTEETTYEEDPICFCELNPEEELCDDGEKQFYEISGMKCYDFNTDGICDDTSDEPGIQNWRVDLSRLVGDSYETLHDTTTGAEGEYLFAVLKAGTYGVCEVFPEGSDSSIWVPTTPASIAPIEVGPDSADNDFGNVCLGAGGGKTLGFWSNKNGKAQMEDDGGGALELALLTDLNLRDADGADFDPSSYGDFRSWLLKAKAVNMAYMLSAQLAAMALNVEAGFVSGEAHVYIDETDCTDNENAAGFITIDDLMDDADDLLLVNGNTAAASPDRACQELLKTTLDKANNNRNFVSDFADCVVDYSGDEPTCPIDVAE